MLKTTLSFRAATLLAALCSNGCEVQYCGPQTIALSRVDLGETDAGLDCKKLCRQFTDWCSRGDGGDVVECHYCSSPP